MEVQGKRCQENGPKAEKDKAEKATGLGRRTREEIKKSGIMQSDSPEILDRGETSEILRPPFGSQNSESEFKSEGPGFDPLAGQEDLSVPPSQL